MLNKFKQRSYELERIDKGDYTPEEYEGCIVELQRVNRWLGDAHVRVKRCCAMLHLMVLRVSPSLMLVRVLASCYELFRNGHKTKA